MARPPKEGLDYFNVDIDMFDDGKLLLAQELIDPDGNQPNLRLLTELMAVRFLREIFKKGYFLLWDNDTALQLSSKISRGITLSLLKKFSDVLIKSGFFDQNMFNKFSILTSHGVQKRWLFIVMSLKRKKCAIKSEYNLLTLEEIIMHGGNPGFLRGNPSKEGINADQTGNNATNNTLTINNKDKIDNKGSKEGNIDEISKLNTDIPNNDNNGSFPPEETPESGQKPSFPPEETPESGQKPSFPPEETPESGQKPSFPPEETQIIEINKGYLLYSIERCRWNFFNNSQFERTKFQAFVMLTLSLDPKESEGIMEKWSHAFNRKCVSEGTFEYQMTGKDGWSKYFPLWVKAVMPNNSDPDTLFTNKHKSADSKQVAAPKKSKVQDQISDIDEQIKNETDPVKKNELRKKKYEVPKR